MKRDVGRVRPRAPQEAVQRFETPPGHPGQVEVADFRLPWGKRSALIVVRGDSRWLWFRFHERKTMPVAMRGLEATAHRLRRGAWGTFVGSDEGRHRPGWARGGRTVDREPGVRSLQSSLGVSGAGLPT